MSAAADLLLNLCTKDSCLLLIKIKSSGLRDEERTAYDTNEN